MIGKAVKYFKGYVDFYAEGADIEGFLTDCVKNGIYITSIRKQDFKFWGTIDSKDYKRIRKKVRKHSLKAVIIKKHGIKLFYRKHKNKIGFLIGTIFIYLSILFMNYVYILKCADNSLYTGWTNNLDKRIKAHAEGKGAKYTKARLPIELVYFEEYQDKREAMKREYAIKQLKRKEKLELIKKPLTS